MRDLLLSSPNGPKLGASSGVLAIVLEQIVD
jgi:hypothetical protein